MQPVLQELFPGLVYHRIPANQVLEAAFQAYSGTSSRCLCPLLLPQSNDWGGPNNITSSRIPTRTLQGIIESRVGSCCRGKYSRFANTGACFKGTRHTPYLYTCFTYGMCRNAAHKNEHRRGRSG